MIDALTTYFGAVEAVDPDAATDFVLELYDEGVPVPRITMDVLGPAQLRVGELWETGQWSVADEHAATAVTETALSALVQAGRTRCDEHARHAVFACVEGEWHTLPSRMAAAVAASGGARVTVLGPSLPAAQLHRRLEAGDVDVLALSCTMPTNLLGAARCVAAAHELGVPVLVGGRAFGTGPQRAHAIAADAWARDPTAALSTDVQLAGRRCEVPDEALLLDSVDDGTVELAYERVLAEFPRLSAMTDEQCNHTRQDLRWMARYTGAAVLTGDARIIDDLLTWLCRLLEGRVPAAVLTASARLLAETLAVTCPVGAEVLHSSAARVDEGAGTPA